MAIYRNYYFHPIVVVPVDYDLEKDFTYLYKSWPYEFTSFTDEKEVNVEMSSIYVPIGEEKKRKKEKNIIRIRRIMVYQRDRFK